MVVVFPTTKEVGCGWVESRHNRIETTLSHDPESGSGPLRHRREGARVDKMSHVEVGGGEEEFNRYVHPQWRES
jgi:hypothetical protein